MPQLVEVRFKGNRKAYFAWHEPEPLRVQEAVLVESERGLDLGVVSAVGDVAQNKCDRCRGCALNAEPGAGTLVTEDARPASGAEPVATALPDAGSGQVAAAAPPPTAPDRRENRESRRRPPEPVRRVVRRASADDRRIAATLRRQEDDVRRRVRDKVALHGLHMKVSDAEWQWDRGKLTVYFTADRRVDFRALVRDLAGAFRTRIELRQIGVRDEAARLGGIGRCGRELCSASWLPELRPIGLQIAKDQRLSLNPVQISGPCGRLLCCLRYEHEFYVQSRKRFPKEGKTLLTARGAERVHAIDIFRDRVTLRAEDGTLRTVALADLKGEVEEALGRAPAPGGAPADGATAAAREAPAVAVEERPETGPPPDSDCDPEAATRPAEGGTGRRRRRRRRKGPPSA